MRFGHLIKELEKDYNIFEQPNSGGIYQIEGVANIDAITISESPVDYRISFWQNDEGVQTAMKTPEDILNCIKALTF